MSCNEFLELIDKIANEKGFKCEYLILMADEKGKPNSYVHVWHNDIKPCKVIRFLSKILGIGCKKFEKLMK